MQNVIAWGAGMNKMVINHLEKLFVTSDASTIVNELEIQHPAARLIVLAAQAQEQEIGDATNFVSIPFYQPLLAVRQTLVSRHRPPSAGIGICRRVAQ